LHELLPYLSKRTMILFFFVCLPVIPSTNLNTGSDVLLILYPSAQYYAMSSTN
jgi:hypothetical protein